MSNDKTPATLTVDVLEVLRNQLTWIGPCRPDGDEIDCERWDRIESAISAVAGLIQIATEFSDYVAADHNDTSLLDREDMWDRLGSAVSRAKGESA